MMKFLSFIILSFLFASKSEATAYFGASYGKSAFSSDSLDKYKVDPKGIAYGGFFGIGKDLLGLEFFYQELKSTGDISYNSVEYDLNANATAMGVALRFSFEVLYARIGVAQYTLDQSIDIDDATARGIANEIYKIEDEEAKKSGAMFGGGVHGKALGLTWFLDYTRYQITSVGHYDTISAGFAYNFSDKFFSFKSSTWLK